MNDTITELPLALSGLIIIKHPARLNSEKVI